MRRLCIRATCSTRQAPGKMRSRMPFSPVYKRQHMIKITVLGFVFNHCTNTCVLKCKQLLPPPLNRVQSLHVCLSLFEFFLIIHTVSEPVAYICTIHTGNAAFLNGVDSLHDICLDMCLHKKKPI